MSDTWRIGLLAVALGLALVIGIVALVRISELRSDVQRLETLTGEVNSLQASLMTAEEQIAELEDGQRWVSDFDWTIDDNDIPPGCEGEIPVVATWTFQEIERDADVAIEFRSSDDSEWDRYPAEPESEIGHLAVARLDTSDEWQYRVIAESDERVRVSQERDLWELHDLVRQDPMIEVGESVSEDGDSWYRYVVTSYGEHSSPCNEIVEAEIQVYAGDALVETVEMNPEYPGEHMPPGVEIEMHEDDPAEEGEATEDRSVFSIHDSQPAWWSDWIQRDDGVEIFALVEFGDGTEIVMDESGIY